MDLFFIYELSEYIPRREYQGRVALLLAEVEDQSQIFTTTKKLEHLKMYKPKFQYWKK